MSGGEWTYDGTPIQAGARRGAFALTGEHAHFSILGLREMVVVARYYVDSPNNRSKRFVEYTCRDLYTSELYPWARQLSAMGGVDDGDDNTLRPSTSLLPGATGVTGSLVGEQTPANIVDGDQVLVTFIEGSRSRPVIIGVFRHSGSTPYGATAAQGERRLTQHKGTQLELKADGSYVITGVGKTSITLAPDGTYTIDGQADYVVTAQGDVKITASAGGDVVLDAPGGNIKLGELAFNHAVLGEVLNTALSPLLAAMEAFAIAPTNVLDAGFVGIAPTTTTAMAALAVAITTFVGTMSAYLSNKVEVE